LRDCVADMQAVARQQQFFAFLDPNLFPPLDRCGT
jgi:hypothetical protein